jgi:hypothetical protein
MDGLVHVRGRVLIHETELEFLGSTTARVMRRVMRQPLQAEFASEPFALDGGPFGAFARSRSPAMTDESSPWTLPGTPRPHLSDLRR